MLAGNAYATEGVTLSGLSLRGEDRKRTELWRIPFVWVPKGQGADKR